MIKIEGEKCSIRDYQVQQITIPIASYSVPQAYIRVPLIEIYDDEEDDDETIYPYKLRSFGLPTSFPSRLFLSNEKAVNQRDQHTYWETLSSWNKFLHSKPFSKKSEKIRLALFCYTRSALISWDLQKQQAFMTLVRQVLGRQGSDEQAQKIQLLEAQLRQLIAIILTQSTMFKLSQSFNHHLLTIIQNLQRKMSILNTSTTTYLQKHKTLRYINPETGSPLRGNPYLFEVHEILANLQAYHHASTRGAGEIIFDILNSRLNGGPYVIPREDQPSKFTSAIALILKGLCAFDKIAARLSQSKDLFIAHDGSTNGEYFWSFGIGGFDPKTEETWKSSVKVKRTHSHTGSAMARDSEDIIRELQQSQKEQGIQINSIWEYNLVVMDTTSCNSGEVLGFVGMWQRILDLACTKENISKVKVIFIPCGDHVTNTGEEKVDDELKNYLLKKRKQSPKLVIWKEIFEDGNLLLNKHCCTVYSMLRKYHRDIVEKYGCGFYSQRLKDLDSDLRLIIFLDRITENRFLSLSKRKHIIHRNRERILQFFHEKSDSLTDNEKLAVQSLRNPVMMFMLMIGSVSYCGSKEYLFQLRKNMTVAKLVTLVKERLQKLEAFKSHQHFLTQVGVTVQKYPQFFRRNRLNPLYGEMISIFSEESSGVLRKKMQKIMQISDETILRRYLLSTQRYIERALYHSFRYIREHHNPRSSDILLSSFLILQRENMDRFSMVKDVSPQRLKILLTRSHQLYRNKVPEYQRLLQASIYRTLVLKFTSLEKNDKETVKLVREELFERKILLKKEERIEMKHLHRYYQEHAKELWTVQKKIRNAKERFVSMINGIARIVRSRLQFVQVDYSSKKFFKAMAAQLEHIENRKTRFQKKNAILGKRKMDLEDLEEEGPPRKKRKVTKKKK